MISAVKIQARIVGTKHAMRAAVCEILGVQVCKIPQKVILSLYMGRSTQNKDVF